MADGPSTRIPKVLHQPISVDFIENRLPHIHEAFENLPIRYDAALKRFVREQQPTAMNPGHQQHGRPLPNTAGTAPLTQRLSPRKLPPAIGAMSFWNHILKEAKDRHQQADMPKKLLKEPQFGIRDKDSWDKVHEQLQQARVKFDGTKSTFVGKFQKTHRWLADNISIMRQALSFVPDHLLVTPVKAAVEIVLDAGQAASVGRNKANEAMDGEKLGDIFAKVEVFLATFPKDENIHERSVDLVACILRAIELAIEYFLSSSFGRAMKGFAAAGKICDYQEELIAGINELEVKSQNLIREAEISHIVETREAMSRILEGVERVTLLEWDNGGRIKVVSEKINLLEEQGRQVITATEQSLVKITTLQENQETTNRALDVLVGFANTALGLLRDGERKRDGQDQQMSTQNGYVVPVSSVYLFPLPTPELVIHVGVILDILNISDQDKRDMGFILESGHSIALEYLSRAKQIVYAREFRAWATSATSCELLIQGDPSVDTVQATFAMSLVSASLMQGLRNRDRYVSLVFFCDQHIESDDAFAGANSMIRSLTAQLLQQHFANATFRAQDIDQVGLRNWDINVLCWLFGQLVRQLPRQKTLICILDGVGVYENAKYEGDLRTMLDLLLGLTRDESISPAVKVLATSPMGTVSLHKAFDPNGDDSRQSVLLMQGLPLMGEEVGMLELQDQEM